MVRKELASFCEGQSGRAGAREGDVTAVTGLGGAYRRTLARTRAARSAVVQDRPTEFDRDEGDRVQRKSRAREGHTRAERISCHFVSNLIRYRPMPGTRDLHARVVHETA